MVKVHTLDRIQEMNPNDEDDQRVVSNRDVVQDKRYGIGLYVGVEFGLYVVRLIGIGYQKVKRLKIISLMMQVKTYYQRILRKIK